MLGEEREVVRKEMLFEELFLLVDFINEGYNLLEGSSGFGSDFEGCFGQDSQGFTIIGKVFEDALVQTLFERHVHYFLAVVEVQEQTYFTHPVGHCSKVGEQFCQVPGTWLFEGSQFALDEDCQFVFEHVEDIGLSARFGEFEDAVVGELEGDCLLLVEHDKVQTFLQFAQQSASVAFLLHLLVLLAELHLN